MKRWKKSFDHLKLGSHGMPSMDWLSPKLEKASNERWLLPCIVVDCHHQDVIIFNIFYWITATTTLPTNKGSVVSQPFIDSWVISSPKIPILPGQALTQSDHEDNLIIHIDKIIGNFISRFNRQHLYDRMLRWTGNAVSNRQYNVVVIINRPGDLWK